MGLYDRDYIRNDRAASGGPARRRVGIPSLGMWSVNTWIIAVCVGVFVVDQLVPPSAWKPVLVEQQLPIHAQLFENPNLKEFPSANESANGFRRPVYNLTTDPRSLVGYNVYNKMPPLQRWLYFSTARLFSKFPEWWRLIGFQFLHANPTHLLFNMLGLYFFGPLVEDYLGTKRYLAFYLLCGIFGALMYMLLNLLGILSALYLPGVHIPGLLFSSMATPLVGASAGIFGVLMAGAYLAPRAVVYVFYILPMQLRTAAYALLGVALFSVIFGGNNAGGEAGHLGGALAGFYFIRHPHHLHGFFDLLGRVDPTSHHYRGAGQQSSSRPGSIINTIEVNRILDKIRGSGLQSLTDDEKRTLQEASRQGRAS